MEELEWLYHQRSMVENKMHCIKFLGERVKYLGPSSANSTNCTSESPFSIGSLNWPVRKRWLWHSNIWGQGKFGRTLIYATAPRHG